jgi:hypothetical protein
LNREENRELLLKCLENDYRNYGLDYLQPQEIERRQLKVVLPTRIFQNLLEIFYIFLDSLRAELL